MLFSNKAHKQREDERFDALKQERIDWEENSLPAILQAKTAQRVIERLDDPANTNTAIKNQPSIKNNETPHLIYEDTILLIPTHLTKQYPFHLFHELEWNIPLSRIMDLDTSAKKTVMRHLSGFNFDIVSNDEQFTTNLNSRITLWEQEGSLHQFIMSPHQTSLKSHT